MASDKDQRTHLEHALCFARAALADRLTASTERVMAQWLVDNLGRSAKLDADRPEVYPGEVIVTRELVGRYTPDEAMLVAKAIILAAEQAKGAV